MQMANIENFDMLPRKHRMIVRQMVRGLGLPETDENLAAEALKYRQARGWFIFEYPSTTAGLKREPRFDDADPEMPSKRLW